MSICGSQPRDEPFRTFPIVDESFVVVVTGSDWSDGPVDSCPTDLGGEGRQGHACVVGQ